MTDASGNIVGEQRYYPYGETRITMGTLYTDKLFTGQREMAGLGIYHYQARFYSPRLGRFLSADTIVPNPYHPQDLNRFSYVRNNPIKYIDPTGHAACRTKEECEDMGTTPNGGGSLGGGNSSGGSGGKKSDPDPGDGEGEELTNVQLAGQAITFALIEVFILLPIDYGLVALTADAAVACGVGVVLACAAEIPILAVDLVVVDFQVSLANTIAQNVATGTRHEFEWIIIPKLLEWAGGK